MSGIRMTALAIAAGALLFPSSVLGRDLAVSGDGAVLLGSCGDASTKVADLPEGQRLRLRFAIAGASNRCYSVSTEIDGRSVSGYVSKQAVQGLEAFEKERRQASAGQLAAGAARSIRVIGPMSSTPSPAVPTAMPAVAGGGVEAEALQAAIRALEENRPQDAPELLAELPAAMRDAAVLRAQAYLQMTRPADAWAAIQPALQTESAQDPALLGLAGVAAFQQDRKPQARQYLRQSLALEHNPMLEKLYRKIEIEEQGDQSDEATYGSRFVMRYEGEALPQEAARELARHFDSEITRVTRRLGCPMNDRLTVVVQALESYRRSTGAAEWSGGRYDGRIHIAVPPSGAPDEHVRQTFAHEFVHACLAKKGKWPAWLHEGLAQALSGEKLSAGRRQALVALQQQNKLPTLAQLSGGWARLGDREAAVAYALALAAAEILHQDLQDYGLRELLNQPERLADVQKQLDRKLQDAFSR